MLADAGYADAFVAYPVWPQGAKGPRLRELHDRIQLAVGVDSAVQVEALAAAPTSVSRPLRVLVEVDTGGRRSGVPPAEAAKIAVAAARLGLEVCGVFTHGVHSYGLGEAARHAAREEVDGLATAVEGLERAGLQVSVVSAGSTRTALLSAAEPGNEERPGTYVFGDRQQVAIGSCAPSEVALVVATTVVSRAVSGQLVVDAPSRWAERLSRR